MCGKTAKTAISFYHWSKDVGENDENGHILLPQVEGCGPKPQKRPYPSTTGRRMCGKTEKTAVSFYRRSKDVRQKRRKRPYPSTTGRRMCGKTAKTAISFYHWSKDVGENDENGHILLPQVEGCGPKPQKRPYPSTTGRRMCGKTADALQELQGIWSVCARRQGAEGGG